MDPYYSGGPAAPDAGEYRGGVGLDAEDDDPTIAGSRAAQAHTAGVLPLWGNSQTLNLNPLILTNIQGSPYYKTSLATLRTHTEIVDEIYYKVDHLEPWERGSRKTSGQTGMCGGVRGVGAGGIVSSAYCLLFKLASVKLTRKQLFSILDHCDSPYIRGIGFMYIRYSQPPSDFWDWFSPYLNDMEEIDVKAGGGKVMTIGSMVRTFMERLEWFDTRFPRIPVTVQKQIADELIPIGNDTKRHDFEPVCAPEGSQPRSRSLDRNRGEKEHRRQRSSSRSRVDHKQKKHKKKESRRSKSRNRSRSRSPYSRESRERSRLKSKKKRRHRSRSKERY